MSTAEQIVDLEALVLPLAVRPTARTWVPLSLYTASGDPVRICLVPRSGRSVLITDEGEFLANFRDAGLQLSPQSKLLEDVARIARRYGFDVKDGAIFRVIEADEIPPAVLNLAEAQIAISGRLFAYMQEQHELQFRVVARQEVSERLSKAAMRVTHFDLDYPAAYHEGDFFCFVEATRPLGVKVVTNKQNMLDALVVKHIYAESPIDLAALKKPDVTLGGRRVINFEGAYQGRIFESAVRLANFINKVAS
jgi:hypothetical protein